MSDQKTDASALLADSIARESNLRSCLIDLRFKFQNLQEDYSELEQEMADLRRELATQKRIDDYVRGHTAEVPPQLSWWERIDNWIKRRANK